MAKILVIEDEAAIRRVLIKILTEESSQKILSSLKILIHITGLSCKELGFEWILAFNQSNSPTHVM